MAEHCRAVFVQQTPQITTLYSTKTHSQWDIKQMQPLPSFLLLGMEYHLHTKQIFMNKYYEISPAISFNIWLKLEEHHNFLPKRDKHHASKTHKL